jgi:hypothetical protein
MGANPSEQFWDAALALQHNKRKMSLWALLGGDGFCFGRDARAHNVGDQGHGNSKLGLAVPWLSVGDSIAGTN